MYSYTPVSLGTTPTTTYRCGTTSCVATNAATATLFANLQKHINRVRPMFGLAADGPVTGVIDTVTVVKLIKLAQKIYAARNTDSDPVLYNYAVEVGPGGVTSLVSIQTTAANAGDLIRALAKITSPAAPPPAADGPPSPSNELPTKPGETPPTHAEGAISANTKKTLMFAGGAVLFLSAILLIRKRRIDS